MSWLVTLLFEQAAGRVGCVIGTLQNDLADCLRDFGFVCIKMTVWFTAVLFSCHVTEAIENVVASSIPAWGPESRWACGVTLRSISIL
jgi:hypothetical protein